MMKAMCLAGAAACLFCAAANAQVPDVERGRALYENHCLVCHTSKVHSRPNRMVLTRGDIADATNRWQEQQNLRWGRQELDDVTGYLARYVYKIE